MKRKRIGMVGRASAWMRVCLLLAMALCSRTQAGVMPERTRVVFSQGAGEISVRLANTNDYPVLVQSWVDQGEGSLAPDMVLSSMFVMPSVLRLQPHDISQVRVLYTGEPLPANRESAFWLNLYEIPLLPAHAEPQQGSRLLLGLNTQIKVFYRPPGLPDPAAQWHTALHFQLHREPRQWVLTCRNDSPYFVSFAALVLSDGARQFMPAVAPERMVPPFGQQRYPLDDSDSLPPWQAPRLRYQMLDDTGLTIEHDATLAVPAVP